MTLRVGQGLTTNRNASQWNENGAKRNTTLVVQCFSRETIVPSTFWNAYVIQIEFEHSGNTSGRKVT